MKLTITLCTIALLLLLGVLGFRHQANYDITPDQRLILAEDLPAMRAALAAGANPQGADFPALSYCANRNLTAAIELLLEHGADPNGTPHSRPLILAVARGHLQATTLLLQHGANPNLPTARGKTPLQVLVAMQNPDPHIRNALLAAGARPLATAPDTVNEPHPPVR